MPLPQLETNKRHLHLERLEATLRRRLNELQASPEAHRDCLLTSTRDLLYQIDHALALLNRGLGDCCEICGQPIDEARLGELPYATCCAACVRDRRQ